MKYSLFFLALLTLLTRSLFAQEVEKLSEPQTLLFIRTVPEGAQVQIDGKQAGTTDDLFRVEPGVRRIVIELDGCTPQSKELTVRAGQITRLVLQLKKSPGAIDEADRPVAVPAESVEEILRNYSEAVWTGALPLLDGPEPEKAQETIYQVATAAARRHIMPHKDMVVQYVLDRLPDAEPVDPSLWTKKFTSQPDMDFSSVPVKPQAFWHPLVVADNWRSVVVLRTESAETLGKRALLRACAPVVTMVLDRSLDRPVIATAFGDELQVVHLRRDADGSYCPEKLEWLKRKPLATQDYFILPADASQAQRLIHAFGKKVWATFLPRLDTLEMNEIQEEITALARKHFAGKHEIFAAEGERRLAQLPDCEPFDRSQWRDQFPQADAKEVAKMLREATEEISTTGCLALLWDPVAMADHIRLRGLLQLTNPVAVGMRERVAAAAVHPSDSALERNPDRPVIATRTGDELVIVRLYRHSTGAYDFDDIEWLARKTDVADSTKIAPETTAETGSLSFRPVIERVVNDDKTGSDWMIDLDTGKVYTPPTEIDPEKNPQADTGKLMAWVRQQGIDATGIKAQVGELRFIEPVLAVVDQASWDSVTQQQVRDALAEAVDPSDKAVVGDTLYAFRTRDGGMGVLQVIRGEDSPSVKIRYKLSRTARDVATDFLTAMREKDDEALKALATDAVTQGWKEALPHFAAELRHNLEVFAKSTDPLTKIEDVIVDGHLAALKAANIKQGYLVLFFLQTSDGWRNCSLKNSPPSVSLTEHLEQFKAKIREVDAEVTPAGRLDLRVAATRGDDGETALDDKAVDRYVENLKTNGPEAGRQHGDPFVWFPMNDTPQPTLITADSEGQMFVLVANTPQHTILCGSEPAWRVTAVSVDRDPLGHPSIRVELDEEGGRRLGELTETHLRRPLAILVDDQVLSAPIVQTKISQRCMITGSFGVEEANRLARTLRSGIASSEAVREPGNRPLVNVPPGGRSASDPRFLPADQRAAIENHRGGQIEKQDRARAQTLLSMKRLAQAAIQIYHKEYGKYPALRDGWAELTQDDGDKGPFLKGDMVNPFTGGSTVAGDDSGDWQYDAETHELRAVVPLEKEKADSLGLTSKEVVLKGE